MRFIFRALWSGGGVVGWFIGAIGGIEYLYNMAASNDAEITITITWYYLVILGLAIVLISALRKAYVIYRNDTKELNNKIETIKRDSAARIRSMFRQSDNPRKPISLAYCIRSEKRGAGDIVPTETLLSMDDRFSTSFGFLSFTNTSQEPIQVEIEYKILSGNVPLLARGITDYTPHMANGDVVRDLEINPGGSYDLPFVTYGGVDIFNMGFKFPSWFMSKKKNIGMRKEGRISKIQLSKGLKITPYIDFEIKIIAFSIFDDTRFLEYLINCQLEANTETNELTITKTLEQVI